MRQMRLLRVVRIAAIAEDLVGDRIVLTENGSMFGQLFLINIYGPLEIRSN